MSKIHRLICCSTLGLGVLHPLCEMEMSGESQLPLTRPSLLGRLRNVEDRVAWMDFYTTYRSPILGFARRAGMSHADAEDITQETILNVAQRMPGFVYDAQKGSFRGWLKTLVARRVVDYFRARNRRLPADLSFQDQTDVVVPPDLEKLWDKEWDRYRLELALKRLQKRINPFHYQVFYSHTVCNWSAEEVCRTFGVKAGTMHVIEHRVRPMFEALMHELRNEPA